MNDSDKNIDGEMPGGCVWNFVFSLFEFDVATFLVESLDPVS
jgi:hypothetical protein